MPGLKLRAALIAAACLCLPSAAGAQTDRPGCAQDTSVLTCITSAAMTLDWTNEEDTQVRVSVTLRISNTTDYPIGVALQDSDFAFTPQNAATIAPDRTPNISGLELCYRSECEFVTVAPGRSALVQISYTGEFDTPGLPLMQVARTASFSGALRIDDRGATRTTPIALEGFAFGNALSRR
jgi:hypothetical protein